MTPADLRAARKHAMTFHEFPLGMSVMDGGRCVGRARRRAGGRVWLGRLYGACWIDAMSDRDRQQRLARLGIRPDYAADLKVFSTKAEARRWLRALANGCGR